MTRCLISLEGYQLRWKLCCLRSCLYSECEFDLNPLYKVHAVDPGRFVLLPPQHGFNCIILKLINMKLTLFFNVFLMFEMSLQFEYLKGNHARSSFIYTIGFWY